MRREGYIIEEITEYSNMLDSFKQVLSGTKRKRSQQGRRLLAHQEKVIQELTESISSGSFSLKPDDIGEMDIVEAGKQRHIHYG